MSKQQAISATEFREMAKDQRRRNKNQGTSKYGNKHTVIDGITFDSKKEAEWYGRCKLRVKAGELTRFEVHVKYFLEVNGMCITTYEADFVEYFKDGHVEVIDIKSEETRKIATYRIKKKLMQALFNIEILEK